MISFSSSTFLRSFLFVERAAKCDFGSLPAAAKIHKSLLKLTETGMTTDTWVTIAGSLGGFCTTFAFVPQVLKIWKQGGRDLSYGMLAIYLCGVILWLVYGLLLHAQAVIITNVATAILIAIATMLKAWTAKRDIVKNTILSAVERG
jgi:MtN3 and saliva related transmembrane protein